MLGIVFCRVSDHAVTKPHADCQNQVAFTQCDICLRGTMHTDHSKTFRVVFRESTLPHQGMGDWNLGFLYKFLQILCRTVGKNHSAPHKEQWMGGFQQCIVDL